MKTKLLIILGLLLIIGLSCESVDEKYKDQYLGRVNRIQYNCDAWGEYITTIKVRQMTFTVIGKIDIPGKHRAFVWQHRSGKTLLLRGLNRISAEYTIIERSRNVCK